MSVNLWYDKPAEIWEKEALPIGNGRLGGMVFGGVGRERIQFNEDSLWEGDENLWGHYQAGGDIFINLNGQEDYCSYKRSLDIERSVAGVEYRIKDCFYRREYFCSHPDQVIAIRLMADQPGRYSGEIELTDRHQANIEAGDGELNSLCVLKNGMKFSAKVLAMPDGGRCEAIGNKLYFKGCHMITVLLAAATDYAMDYGKKWRNRNDDPVKKINRQIKSASEKGYTALLTTHIEDYQGLFGRLSLDLGATSEAVRNLPTNERLEIYKNDGCDPELESLFFQFGRYLLISCSRPGSLPVNLQGLWNNSNRPPWASDYHTDINTSMNYWPAECANLHECHKPLLDFILSQLEPWRKATAATEKFNIGSSPARGWTVKTAHNIFGGGDNTDNGDDKYWYSTWNTPGNAWYSQHFWEHYAYGGDRKYLQEIAYPLLKEVCEFWVDRLISLPDGQLVAPQGWSPEYPPAAEDGVSYDQVLIWELFANYLDAADILGFDAEFRDHVASMFSKLRIPSIGKYGQLQQWLMDRDNPHEGYIHAPHLLGLYPGRLISEEEKPEMASAAKKSLEFCGNRGGYFNAFKICLWARLGDALNAYSHLRKQLYLDDDNSYGCVNPNLLNVLRLEEPYFQIDGNFGCVAGVCEMLLQSQRQVHDKHSNNKNHQNTQRTNGPGNRNPLYILKLLPALPKAWPNGEVRGVRARGGFIVDIVWENSILTSAKVRGTPNSQFRICYENKHIDLTISSGTARKNNAQLQFVWHRCQRKICFAG